MDPMKTKSRPRENECPKSRKRILVSLLHMPIVALPPFVEIPDRTEKREVHPILTDLAEKGIICPGCSREIHVIHASSVYQGQYDGHDMAISPVLSVDIPVHLLETSRRIDKQVQILDDTEIENLLALAEGTRKYGYRPKMWVAAGIMVGLLQEVKEWRKRYGK